jgi:hypothetical protein
MDGVHDPVEFVGEEAVMAGSTVALMLTLPYVGTVRFTLIVGGIEVNSL